MTKKMLIDATQPRDARVVIADRQHIEHFDFITSARSQLKGNIYLAKVTRIEPALQAAFVEYGGDKQGFLSFTEIHPDYYQIPIADRKKLLEEQRLAEEQAEREEDERELRRQDQRRNRRPERNQDQSEGQDGEPQEFLEVSEDDRQLSDEPEYEGEGEDASAEGSEEVDEEGNPRHRRARRSRGGRRRRPFNKRTQEESSPKIEASEEISDEAIEENAEAETPLGEQEVSDLETEIAEMEEDGEQPRMETVSEGDNPEGGSEGRKRFIRSSRRYKIQEVVKPGQIMLVQVIKEERGNKGVSLSTYISLAGRYCVLMPNSPKDGGISRKIGSFEDRKRLKDIAAELKDLRGMSAIIRTAGIDRTKTEIKRDYEYLIKLWNQIRDNAISSNAPALVYEEGNIIKRTIRDCYVPEIEEIVVQGDDAYKEAKDFMKMIMPSHAARVKQFKEPVPIFHHAGIERQLEFLHEPVVRLRSGGYIVINPTEALISIDVNSGRQTTERNVEETAFKTNLEAAGEIARQLKLRDLGGLIVIDFIDMSYGKHRRTVERAFKDGLKTDRAKIQAGHISAFGLLELSRQRLGPNIYETTTTKCHTCHGTGILRSPEALAVQLLRNMQAEAATGEYVELVPTVTSDMAVFLFNTYRRQISELEEQFGITITIKCDNTLAAGTFKMESFRKHRGDQGNRKPRGGRAGGGSQSRHQHEHAPEQEAPKAETADEETASEATEETADGEGPERSEPRGRRGRRGGRNRRRGRDRDRDRSGHSPESSSEEASAETAHDAFVVDADEIVPAEATAPVVAEEPVKEKPAPRRGRRPRQTEEAPEAADTAKAAEALTEPSPEEDGKPKRSGWWRKVVQN